MVTLFFLQIRSLDGENSVSEWQKTRKSKTKSTKENEKWLNIRKKDEVSGMEEESNSYEKICGSSLPVR